MDIDKLIKVGTPTAVGTTCMITTAQFEPGNGTRYDLLWGDCPDGNDPDGPHLFFCTWLKNGGSGGVTVTHPIGGYCHFSYVAEKMEIGGEDAKAIAHLINSLNCRSYTVQDLDTLPRGVRERLAQ